MSVTDEIEKLAGLRNQGLITEKEYQGRKKKLLRGKPADPAQGGRKKRPWYRSWWLTVPVSIGGAVWFYATVVGFGPGSIPKCDSTTAIDYVKKVIADSPAGRAGGLRIVDLTLLVEVGWDSKREIRQCGGAANLNDGTTRMIVFQMGWGDSKKKQIRVQAELQ